jgi:GT2 family glycosyltransferase
MDVSVVIVSWNTRDILRGCLRSVFEQTREVTYEVFVVDNNSRDGSADMVRTEFPRVKLIENAQNRGFAAANNQGLRLALGRYALVLNPDTLILDYSASQSWAGGSAIASKTWMSLRGCLCWYAARQSRKWG